MKKYFLIFFFVFFSSEVLLAKNKPTSHLKGCSFNIDNNYLNKIDLLKIKSIEIDVHDYRGWTVNGVRIITNRFRYVPDKYKKRYDSTVIVTYEDDSKCLMQGRVRHSGDEKDHIGQIRNSITQSLDVHLIDGNIKGITKFKLFRPNTRGNLEDEILITEILRNLDYLAPRSIKVQARVNNVTSVMLFQEKAAKEMLEFNKRREGPILEADERFFYKSVSKIEDNNLSGWDMGVVGLKNESSKHMLSKQVNTNILEKSYGHKTMSLNAINNLNLIYLYFSNRFQDELNNFNYFEYDLDNNLLGLFDEVKISKLNEYNLFMQATNSTHGLATNNRKFYWNPIENYFEPINYDSNADINNNIPDGILRYPISKNYYSSFSNLKMRINNINYSTVLKNLNLSGLNFSKVNLEKKINKILVNLNKLEKNYLNFASEKMTKHNRTKNINNILDKFHKSLKENHPNTYLIKNSLNKNSFQKCEIFLEKCINVELSPLELASLLEGDLFDDNKFFQFLGYGLNFEDSINSDLYSKLSLNDTKIYFEKGVEINLDEMNNKIFIKQIVSGAKTFLIDGTLKDTEIIYEGVNLKNINQKSKPKGFPINEKGLTGCVSLINLKIERLKINAKNGSCEDLINFINSKGNVDLIEVTNSMSDALDIDFSNLKIKNINIYKAENDCVDFSYGNYAIENLNLNNCGDKALSVGEKSKLILDEIIASNSIIGIASKDSSSVSFNNGNFNNVDTCLAAYKKKQEFEGGIIKYSEMDCNFTKEKINNDKVSLIYKKNIKF